jgi:hypothetical protein
MPEERPSTRLQDLVRKPATPRGVRESSTAAGNSNASAATSSDGPSLASGDAVSIETLVGLWPKIRADVKSLDRRTEALLMEIDPVAVTADEVVLAAAYEFHRDKVNEDERRAIVETVIGRLLDRSIRVSCVLRAEFVPQGANRKREAAPVPAPITEVEETPEVQAEGERADEKMLGAVVRMFDGEIVEE